MGRDLCTPSGYPAVRPIAFLTLLPLMLAACSPEQGNSLRVTGQIEGDIIHAGSKVGGRVLEVAAQEGQAVKAGEVLVRLDDAEAQAVLAAAKANEAKAAALLAKLEAGATGEQLRQAEAALDAARQQYELAVKGPRDEEIRAARAAVDAARAQSQTAKGELERLQPLADREAVSKMELDRARGMADAAAAQTNMAAQKLSALESGARPEEIATAKAALDRAQAMLDEVKAGARSEDVAAAQAARQAAAADVKRAETALREMAVLAPMDAVVESIDVRAGDLIKPGAVVRMVNPDDLELDAYVSALMLARVRLGQKVPITTDAYGAERFEGEIVYIAAEGEFTPRNLQTEEERVQQVFEVKIKLDSAGGRLRAGMSATAHFDERAPASK